MRGRVWHAGKGQLDFVSFRIGDPGKTAIVLIFALGIDLDALGIQRPEQRV